MQESALYSSEDSGLQNASEGSRSGTLSLYFLLFIWVLANEGFKVATSGHIAGVGNLSDLALVVVLVSLGYIALRARRRSVEILKNPFTWFFLVFLVFATVQASLASFNYGESIPSALVGIRQQYHFLSFFLFLFVLDDLDKIRKFLNLLIGVAVIVFALSLVNYFGPTIFVTKYAEGHGVRSGIVRAVIPGMETVALAFLWATSKWIYASSTRSRTFNGAMSVLLLGVIFFRQTRVRILGATCTLVWMLVIRRRYKMLLGLTAAGLIVVGVLQVVMEENILLVPFTSVAENVTQDTGTWQDRSAMMGFALRVFNEHPILGSGTLGLRRATIGSESDKGSLTKTVDLGHLHWLKHHGIAGSVWLYMLLFVMWLYSVRSEKLLPIKHAPLALLVHSYVPYFLILFTTYAHLFHPHGMMTFSLLAAIVVQCNREVSRPASNKV